MGKREREDKNMTEHERRNMLAITAVISETDHKALFSICLYLPYSTASSMFPLPSASASVGYGSLVRGRLKPSRILGRSLLY